MLAAADKIRLRALSRGLRHAIVRRNLPTRHRSCVAAADPFEEWQDPLPEGVTAVLTKEDAERAVHVLMRLDRETPIAWDTETIDIDVKTQSPCTHGKVICASAYGGPQIDFGFGPKLWIDSLADPGTLGVFQNYFSDPDRPKVFHNASFDSHVLHNNGITVKGFGGDTLHMARLFDSSRMLTGGYSLEALCKDWLPEGSGMKITMKERFGGKRVRKADGKTVYNGKLPPLDLIQTESGTRAAWVDYSTMDALLTWELCQELKVKLEQVDWHDSTHQDSNAGARRSMWQLYNELWKPFGEMLIEMERTGIRVDKDHLKRIEILAREQKEQAEKMFVKWVANVSPGAEQMNISSDAQKQQLFFAPCTNSNTQEYREVTRTFETENVEGIIEEGKKKAKKNRPFELSGLGFKPVEYTKSGWPSTSSAILTKLAGDVNRESWGYAYHEVGGGERGKQACIAIDNLQQVSSMNKLVNTFMVPLQEKADKNDRIHTSLNINTETGRLSSRNPNLQNQPALEKDKFKIRKAFCSAPGNTLVVADYGQLELRILAHLSNCTSMIEAFKSGGDFHSRTAIGMYPHMQKAIEDGEVLLEWDESKGEAPIPLVKNVYGSERRKAKTLNFSIAYGKTPIGLAKDWNVTRQEAQNTLELWYSDRPEVKEWQQNTIKTAHETGWTRTLLGRLRKLPGINAKGRGYKGHAERAAINTPVQGGAADIVTLAMLKMWRDERLKEMGWTTVLQIHDEVILEGPKESAEEAFHLVKSLMESPFPMNRKLLVDLTVDGNIADTWYEAK